MVLFQLCEDAFPLKNDFKAPILRSFCESLNCFVFLESTDLVPYSENVLGEVKEGGSSWQ